MESSTSELNNLYYMLKPYLTNIDELESKLFVISQCLLEHHKILY
jgi:hypothetical protein